jgi:hypothetical protein
MAFILVYLLLISKAYSFDDRQISVLRVQSKASAGMAALQATHGSRHDFFIIYKTFRAELLVCVGFTHRLVVFCRCTMTGQKGRANGKALADVPGSC